MRRGREADAHGLSWQRQYHLSRPEEKAWIEGNVQAIEEAIGNRLHQLLDPPRRQHPGDLQELGFRYHIDGLSADEPFLQTINGKPFAIVPYTVHLNDIVSYEFAAFDPAASEQQLDEFDQLYEEGAHRRRMMVIALHDRLSGHASRVRVLDRVLTRLRERDGVWWDRVADHVGAHLDVISCRRGPGGEVSLRGRRTRRSCSALGRGRRAGSAR